MSKSEPGPLDSLQEAHRLMCQECVRLLKNEERTATDLKVVMQFLKDNKIEAVPKPGSALQEVVETAEMALPDFSLGTILSDDDPAFSTEEATA